MRFRAIHFLGMVIAACWISSIEAAAPNTLLKEPVTLHCESTPLREVLHSLSEQISASFVFRDPLVENIMVSYDIKNGLLEDVLTYLLPEHRLSYKVLPDGLIVLIPRDIKKPGNVTQQVFESPKVIYKTEPIYPAAAIRQNASGLVCLCLRINNRGEVDSVRLKTSSGFTILDSAAVDYASKLRFSPALSNNKPVPIWMEWEFNYKFSDMTGVSKMISQQ
jgi:TonB family protein